MLGNCVALLGIWQGKEGMGGGGRTAPWQMPWKIPVFQKERAVSSPPGLRLYASGCSASKSRFCRGRSQMAKAAMGSAVKAAL